MAAIDSEFQSLIPPLSEDEYERLERSILAEGVRDPIITWNNTIIDGHNRYHICEEHGIRCPQVEREFESRDAAKIWIIENQFGRRNLNKYQRSVLALELESLIAGEAEKRLHLSQGRGVKGVQKSAQVSDSGKTRDKVAAIAGVSHDTISKVKAIEAEAEKGNPVAIEEREALSSGEKRSIHGAYVRVTGKQKRRPEDTVAEDGRRICVMCGEPIDPGDAHPARPTVHKKCEQEYQRDWERSRKPKLAEDGRRICTICGEPIDEGEAYDYEPTFHKKCRTAQHVIAQRKYRNPTIGDTSEVLEHDKDELRDSLLVVAEDMADTLQATIGRYETMGVKLGKSEAASITKALDSLVRSIKKIRS